MRRGGRRHAELTQLPTLERFGPFSQDDRQGDQSLEPALPIGGSGILVYPLKINRKWTIGGAPGSRSTQSRAGSRQSGTRHSDETRRVTIDLRRSGFTGKEG